MVLLLSSLGILVVLGVVQGLTEFLPISSSGHLVLWSEWLGAEKGPGLTTEVALHLGTVVAVVVFCRRDLASMLRMRSSPGLWRVVVGASAVTAAFGLTLGPAVEENLGTVFTAGCGLLVTAGLLVFATPRDDARLHRSLDDGTLRDALVLGLFQSAALVPGVSRAGATLAAAMLLGYRRPEAVRAAFLISVPAVAGAVVLKAGDGAGREVLTDPEVMAGMAASFVVGLAALRFISVHVDRTSLVRFAIYCAGVGSAAILTAVWSG